MSAWLTRIFQCHRSPEDRFVALVFPHIRRMHRMAYRWTMDSVDADDLVQDVLTALVPRVVELESIDRLGPWLIKVLYRRYVDLYRRRRACPIEYSGGRDGDSFCDESGGDDYEQQDLRRALSHALMALEDDWRDTVLLHDVEGYTAVEVAEILDISVGTVKSRLHRARQKLKKMLTQGTITARHAC